MSSSGKRPPVKTPAKAHHGKGAATISSAAASTMAPASTSSSSRWTTAGHGSSATTNDKRPPTPCRLDFDEDVVSPEEAFSTPPDHPTDVRTPWAPRRDPRASKRRTRLENVGQTVLDLSSDVELVRGGASAKADGGDVELPRSTASSAREAAKKKTSKRKKAKSFSAQANHQAEGFSSQDALRSFSSQDLSEEDGGSSADGGSLLGKNSRQSSSPPPKVRRVEAKNLPAVKRGTAHAGGGTSFPAATSANPQSSGRRAGASPSGLGGTTSPVPRASSRGVSPEPAPEKAEQLLRAPAKPKTSNKYPLDEVRRNLGARMGEADEEDHGVESREKQPSHGVSWYDAERGRALKRKTPSEKKQRSAAKSATAKSVAKRSAPSLLSFLPKARGLSKAAASGESSPVGGSSSSPLGTAGSSSQFAPLRPPETPVVFDEELGGAASSSAVAAAEKPKNGFTESSLNQHHVVAALAEQRRRAAAAATFQTQQGYVNTVAAQPTEAELVHLRDESFGYVLENEVLVKRLQQAGTIKIKNHATQEELNERMLTEEKFVHGPKRHVFLVSAAAKEWSVGQKVECGVEKESWSAGVKWCAYWDRLSL